jgi:hypothetical protein
MVIVTLNVVSAGGLEHLTREFPTANKIERTGEDIHIFRDSELVAIFKGHALVGAEIQPNAHAQAAK